MLTIASVVGIPPTLVASMYGMNFHNMPELSWAWGYPYGLALIALSAAIPLIQPLYTVRDGSDGDFFALARPSTCYGRSSLVRFSVTAGA